MSILRGEQTARVEPEPCREAVPASGSDGPAIDRARWQVPETKVLAIASHVSHGYVGNKMASFVMQVLGCDVSAINTVNYSNHVAYRQFTGTKTSPQEIWNLYKGMRKNRLTDFDVVLTGYVPSADSLAAVRDVVMHVKARKPNIFWVLDPVMGDQGKIYVSEDQVPIYRSMLSHAQLILPNQFELELLYGSPVTSLTAVVSAIEALHKQHGVPHIVVTSLALPETDSATPPTTSPATETSVTATTAARTSPTRKLTVIGSTMRTSDRSARIFRIDVPALDCFFSGTGDLFAGLIVARLRAALVAADAADRDTGPVAVQRTAPGQRPSAAGPIKTETFEEHCHDRSSLEADCSVISPDPVRPSELPLAVATRRALASMQTILTKTYASIHANPDPEGSQNTEESDLSDFNGHQPGSEILASWEPDGVSHSKEELERRKDQWKHACRAKASEVKVVRYVADILDPVGVDRLKIVEVGNGQDKGIEETGITGGRGGRDGRENEIKEERKAKEEKKVKEEEEIIEKEAGYESDADESEENERDHGDQILGIGAQ